jgi:protein-S-isoprenylcysteine O-methyltransferase Ste14
MGLSPISPWVAKVVVLAASVAMIAIRAPHGQRSREARVAKDFKGKQEVILLSLAWIGFFVPLIWMVSPAFAFADYPLHLGPLVAGVVCIVAGLWLFYRSHADLGTNWSITLQLREQHRLVTSGVYRPVRHPMYLAILVYSIGQALVLSNWFAGPSYLVAFAILFAFRLRAEEKMMRDQFGDEYAAYMAKTKRLIPGIW